MKETPGEGEVEALVALAERATKTSAWKCRWELLNDCGCGDGSNCDLDWRRLHDLRSTIVHYDSSGRASGEFVCPNREIAELLFAMHETFPSPKE
jgi:hypothetical protein